MVSILWLLIGIVIISAISGSLIFEFLTPNNDSMTSLEKKCEGIAKEGFRIHVMYPDLQPDQLPSADMNRLMYLDEMWIKDCVSRLSAESVFNIIQKVEHDFYSGE
ncbi:hypothetical protein [Nitrosarchaeum sp. AC2]|uniref:hypothetical protein n=1 Tax=Nitrosarchaeum sp. AC2 TaxID=2259673 RepID=UPI0015CAB36B|nr:hypothetical protein [Nitrosarchaeum sp. AC2]QLH11485.1 hypothetical protein DSQ20_08575 [Nitrosarchaeum sp. AC2]